MKRIVRAALIVATIFAIGLAGSVSATQPDKVTICHASGLAGTTKFETLTIGYPAVFGPAGHFYENGTPRAGHEQDYMGPCLTPTESPSASLMPSPETSPSTEPTDSPSPSATSSILPPTSVPTPPNTATEPDSNVTPIQQYPVLFLIAGLGTLLWAFANRRAYHR